jgi:endonuclease-3
MSEHVADTRAEAVVDALGLLYHDDLDPAEFMLFPDDNGAMIEAETDVSAWQQTYGGRTAFECLVRTILSQNTSDSASQPAHESLMDRYGSDAADLATALAGADETQLAETIKSAGLYNQKSSKIVQAAQLILHEYGAAAAFDEFVTEADPETVRETLLEIDGVGPKTADCVLLFAGGTDGVFPVDTHVHRIARRLGIAAADGDHETVRRALEAEVPSEKCGFGHTAMIQFGREYCTANRPACLDDPEACPLASLCDRVGVDDVEETAVDPAATVD